MTKDPLLYVQHILKAIGFIEQFTSEIEKDIFLKDRMRYDATLRNLQTLAEATQNLPQEIKAQYSHIPWKDISGFRNIIVHNYLEGPDVNVIWYIIKNELTPIKISMLEVLNRR